MIQSIERRGPRLHEQLCAPFIYKSLSTETRSSYRRALGQFFQFIGWLHPAEITKGHVLAYREQLVRSATGAPEPAPAQSATA